MRMVKAGTCFLILACLLICTADGWAQTTGKIAGHITDQSTGEPLIGANVILKGTQMGSATDMNGDFYILNIYPGMYSLEIRMMGYKTIKMDEVRVSVNRTSRIALEMEFSVIEGETVSVLAERIAIKKDQTNSIRNISSDDIQKLPAEDIDAIVRMQPGIAGNHFRGGRSNEAVYMIDGIKVTESFRQENRSVEVNPEAVADIEVITGTFNAEYGDAMSGVVNIITKEGRRAVEGSITGYLGNYLTSHGDKFVGLSNSEVDRIKDIKFNLSGPVWEDKLTFLLDGRLNDDQGYLNGIYHFNPHDYSDYAPQDRTLWHTEDTGDESYVSLSDRIDLVVFGKLTYKPAPAIKMSLSSTYNQRESQWYNHTYKYNPYGMSHSENESMMWSYQLNHMIGSNSFYELKLSYSDYQTGDYVFEDPLDPRYVHDEYNRSNGFSTGGQNKGHTVRTEKTLNLKLDYSRQINKRHFLKTGIDLSRITLDQDYRSIQNAYRGTSLEYTGYYDGNNEVQFPYYEPTTYSDSSTYSDIYTHEPIKFALFVQDKMEYESMVINLGVRFDYFDADAIYPTNYRNPANLLHQLESSRYSTYPKADPQYQISPRLGLSYQLGESALLRFSYGHFLQLPPLDYFYQNNSHLVQVPDFTTRMGNPNLNVQKTIQYEVGLWQQLNDMMSVEVAVYYRDIYDLVTATIFTTYDQIRYGVYTNSEYGNARGLEVKYDFRHKSLMAGMNYTLGYTRGVADDPQMSFNRAGNSMDPVNKMIPMAWDQRHVFNTFAGVQKETFGATAMLYYFSGEAYTWNPIAQSPLARINLFPNNQHKPARYILDLNAFYQFLTMGRMKMRLTLMAYNLLDRLNENNVNGATGRADQFIVQESDLAAHRSDYHEYSDQVLNPSNFSNPRIVKLGIGVTF
ncbi:TonB-dependent receptor [candidate division KSB1 bacterium]|nr:TonB-dependent receptor [candidate division KSB1 bacterium]